MAMRGLGRPQDAIDLRFQTPVGGCGGAIAVQAMFNDAANRRCASGA